jgi:hypothetical protein
MNKNTDEVLQRTADDEPIFVLTGRDPSAAKTVIRWIAANLDTAPDDKLRAAFEQVLRMRDYQPKRVSGTPWVTAWVTDEEDPIYATKQ